MRSSRARKDVTSFEISITKSGRYADPANPTPRPQLETVQLTHPRMSICDIAWTARTRCANRVDQGRDEPQALASGKLHSVRPLKVYYMRSSGGGPLGIDMRMPVG